jgi:hypothetical protein
LNAGWKIIGFSNLHPFYPVGSIVPAAVRIFRMRQGRFVRNLPAMRSAATAFYAVLPAGGCPRGQAERAIPESRALVLYAAIGDRYFLRGEKGDFLGNFGEFPYHCRSKIRKCGFFRGFTFGKSFSSEEDARRSPGWISGRSSRNVSST